MHKLVSFQRLVSELRAVAEKVGSYEVNDSITRALVYQAMTKYVEENYGIVTDFDIRFPADLQRDHEMIIKITSRMSEGSFSIPTISINEKPNDAAAE